jgi:hypothetical protein
VFRYISGCQDAAGNNPCVELQSGLPAQWQLAEPNIGGKQSTTKGIVSLVQLHSIGGFISDHSENGPKIQCRHYGTS